jgi:cbb3-type cytochrome oxidase subunit 3
MDIAAAELIGVLYMTGVLVAVLAALIPRDQRRREDARKVLCLLLCQLPQVPPQRSRR